MFVFLLELLRDTFISKHLKILDDDNCFSVLKKNILLSFYDGGFEGRRLLDVSEGFNRFFYLLSRLQLV